MYTHTCVNIHAHVCTGVHRRILGLLLYDSLPYSSETGSLLSLELGQQPANSRDPPVSSSHSPGLQAFYVCVGEFFFLILVQQINFHSEAFP